MKQIVVRGIASVCCLAFCAFARMASAQATTIRVQSSLVLVDVISQDPKTGLPVRGFKKDDFHLLDNLHEVRIATFDTSIFGSSSSATKPDYQSLAPRWNFSDRNHSFAPH
jgi:hypothetical protein